MNPIAAPDNVLFEINAGELRRLLSSGFRILAAGQVHDTQAAEE
jgi:hypothetical protein